MSTLTKKVTANALDKVCQEFVSLLYEFFENPNCYTFEEFSEFFNTIPLHLIHSTEITAIEEYVPVSKMPVFAEATTYNANYLLPTSRNYMKNKISGLYPYYFSMSGAMLSQMNLDDDTNNFWNLTKDDFKEDMHILYPGASHQKLESMYSYFFDIPTEEAKDYIQFFSALFIGVLNLAGSTYDHGLDSYIKKKPTPTSMRRYFKNTLLSIVNGSHIGRFIDLESKGHNDVFPSCKYVDDFHISTGCLPFVLTGDETDHSIGKSANIMKIQKDVIYYQNSYYLAGVFKNNSEGVYNLEDYTIMISSLLFSDEKFNHISRIITKYYLPLLLSMNPGLKVEILSHNIIQERLSTNQFITKTNSDVRKALLELA